MNKSDARILSACLCMAVDKSRFDREGHPIPLSVKAKKAVALADALVEELFNEEGGEL